MDFPPPTPMVPQMPADRTGDDRPAAGSTTGLGDVAARLRAVESAVEALARQVDAMAASIEPSVRHAVGAELATVSGEMRHTVSELGRLIVRDLGKLTQVLAKHREAIVAELRPGRVAASAAAPAFTPSEAPAEEASADSPPELAPTEATGNDNSDDEPDRPRRRSLRGRRDTSLR